MSNIDLPIKIDFKQLRSVFEQPTTNPHGNAHSLAPDTTKVGQTPEKNGAKSVGKSWIKSGNKWVVKTETNSSDKSTEGVHKAMGQSQSEDRDCRSNKSTRNWKINRSMSDPNGNRGRNDPYDKDFDEFWEEYENQDGFESD